MFRDKFEAETKGELLQLDIYKCSAKGQTVGSKSNSIVLFFICTYHIHINLNPNHTGWEHVPEIKIPVCLSGR